MEDNTTPQVPTPTAQSFAVPFAIVIAGLAIAGAIYFGDNKKGTLPAVAAGDTKANTVAIDPVTPADHILGNPNATIVIVEYSDTECPFCKSFHGTMNRVMGEYGNGGKVAWVYRHFPLPFHSKAPKEAEATECANKLGGNTKFWEYTNKIFEITQGNNQLDPAELPKIAKTVGLDVDAFNKCLTSGEMKAIVDANIASGNKAGVRGTPHSIILVDKKVVTSIDGAQPYESVKATIDGLLK
ncbi:MAG: thioredoxin domain-containing protein [Patescibacteria group bacterium]